MQKIAWEGGSVELLVERAERLLQSDRRSVLGIAGAPASGKSTLASGLLSELQGRHPGAVVLVGMDAFHIGHRLLAERGLVGIKGAPETFDVGGYVALLKRITATDTTIYAPEFHREIEDSLAQTVEIGPSVRLVITEGNYLLLPTHPWNEVRPLLDEAWFVYLSDSERQQRMIARHMSFGHSVEAATTRALGSDELNAVLINSQQNSVDVWIEHQISTPRNA
ncbi:MAG TPA: nucleoside/nucleotide kinase family protein [Propionibacteriaceae bacterium]